MVKRKVSKKRKAIFMTGKTKSIHIYMPRSSMLREKITAKAQILGLSQNDYILRILEKNVEDISVSVKTKQIKTLK